MITDDEEEERPAMKQEHMSSKSLGLGEEEGVYRRGPLVPVGATNRD